MESTKLHIECIIAAAPKKVWDYYTQPKHITQWNFADESWHCPHAENDLRVGGQYFAKMEAKDGSFGFDFKATYTEVIDQQLITYRMEDDRMVSITFEAQDEGTIVSTDFDAEQENPLDMQKEGWQAILNNFKKYTEAH